MGQYDVGSQGPVYGRSTSGKGSALGVPALPFVQGTAVRVELRTNGSACWEASYSTHITNSPEQFKAKSD